MGRILAIDYGLRRTGTAVSDPLRIIAGGLQTVPTHTLRTWIREYLGREDVDVIVVGMPRREDGSPSDSFAQIEPFVRWLRREFPDRTTVLFDERYTSVLAHRAMIDGGMRRSARRDKEAVDRIAATIILEDFMASRQYADMTGEKGDETSNV